MARVTLTVQLMHAQQRIAVLERELHEANERCAQLEAAKPLSPLATKPQAAAFNTYAEYVQACRVWCHRATRPVSYLARDDWEAAHHEAQRRDEADFYHA